MLKNKMESYVRIGRRGLKNLMYPYMAEGEGVLLNGPSVIFSTVGLEEWDKITT